MQNYDGIKDSVDEKIRLLLVEQAILEQEMAEEGEKSWKKFICEIFLALLFLLTCIAWDGFCTSLFESPEWREIWKEAYQTLESNDQSLYQSLGPIDQSIYQSLGLNY